MNKRVWLEAAEIFDSLRVVPRVFLFGYSLFAVYLVIDFMHWYFRIGQAERGIEASGAMTIIIGTVFKFWVDIFETYTKSSRDWNQIQQMVTAQTSTTVTAPAGAGA